MSNFYIKKVISITHISNFGNNFGADLWEEIKTVWSFMIGRLKTALKGTKKKCRHWRPRG